MRYLPNKRDALQAHMHKVHKLGNAQLIPATTPTTIIQSRKKSPMQNQLCFLVYTWHLSQGKGDSD